MQSVFINQFGPQGPMPLREPLFHEVESFYAEAKKTNAHNAMGILISKISGASAAEVDELPLTTLRQGQAYLLDFINHDPQAFTGPSLEVTLEKMITSLNGQEAWQSVTVSEPTFAQFKTYYDKLEKGDSYAALLWLASDISGVNLVALKKMPITKFREVEKYLLGFLRYFPEGTNGATS